ncbi:hypothetical protein [Gloeothece verrucosa]|uniref:Uncharacterized protein n=1 Tax=Gloeothece verrucosa (strain PCC 7822) TaxID=497965 RepID=E0U6U1_GLOV7|nr:hypothetical protein [Gloeothece verrucosa]ADN15978.1 hypothetical protein Cyan7822_4055 [Gloeothece verrucosa PCC 7822]
MRNIFLKIAILSFLTSFAIGEQPTNALTLWEQVPNSDLWEMGLGYNQWSKVNNDLTAVQCPQPSLYSSGEICLNNLLIDFSILNKNKPRENHPVQTLIIPQPTEPNLVPGLICFASFLAFTRLINIGEKIFDSHQGTDKIPFIKHQ